MGYSQGVSGLNAAATTLDVIGNNIANSSTIGYKSGGVLFADVYSGSSVGLGSQVNGIAQNFSAGAAQTSTRPLDMAITGGEGFFRLTSPTGEVSYSRNGQFNRDKDGYIVNSTGLRLTGYQATDGIVTKGSPSPLELPNAAMPPKATTDIAVQFNLDADSTVPTTTPVNPNDPASYTYASSATVYDSQGDAHEVSTFFAKAADNTWRVYATADGRALNANGAMSTSTTPSMMGTIVFDSSGKLATGGTLNFANLNFGNGAAAMNFKLDMDGTTQFSSANEVRALSQDGYAPGTLQSFAVNPDGTITGSYSNQKSLALGQVVLSSFVDPQGLQSKGSNVWVETPQSGQPLTNAPGPGTRQGSLMGGALESSNVDLTAELVNMIIAQRTYQANAQTIKTQDQVSQTLMNLR